MRKGGIAREVPSGMVSRTTYGINEWEEGRLKPEFCRGGIDLQAHGIERGPHHADIGAERRCGILLFPIEKRIMLPLGGFK